jgi:UDP-glucose 4-epimerase
VKSRALVTGGAGFIGSHLVRRLLTEGWQVCVLDDLSSGVPTAVAPGAEFVEGDVRDVRLLGELMAGCQRVFHLAAFVNLPESFERRDECMSVNVDGTRCVLDAALKSCVEKVVFSSTSALYPDKPADAKREEGPLATVSPYAESKLEGERLLRAYGERGLRGVALRYFNVFGPGQPADSDYAAVVPLFIARALAGQYLNICGDGQQTRDFVYVEDVAGANWRAAEFADSGTFNVGTGQPITIVGLAEIIAGLLGGAVELNYIAPRPGDALSSTADCARAVRELGWSAAWPLEEGLRQTIAWWQGIEEEEIHV